jgi:hypothetical protein
MDASGRINRIKAGTYYLLPGGSDLATDVPE